MFNCKITHTYILAISATTGYTAILQNYYGLILFKKSRHILLHYNSLS